MCWLPSHLQTSSTRTRVLVFVIEAVRPPGGRLFPRPEADAIVSGRERTSACGQPVLRIELERLPGVDRGVAVGVIGVCGVLIVAVERARRSAERCWVLGGVVGEGVCVAAGLGGLLEGQFVPGIVGIGGGAAVARRCPRNVGSQRQPVARPVIAAGTWGGEVRQQRPTARAAGEAVT